MQFSKNLSAFVTIGAALLASGVSATPLGMSSIVARDGEVDLQNPYRIIFVKGTLGRRDVEEDLQNPYRIIFVKGTLGRRDDSDPEVPVGELDLVDRDESDTKVDLQTPYRIIFIKGT